MIKILNGERIVDYLFLFMSASIIPLSFFAPIGLWIPLLISSVIFFLIEKNKKIFIKFNSKIELLLIILILYMGLSLLWSINFSHGLTHLIHLSILFFSLKIVLTYCKKIKNLNRIKKTLFFSFIISCVISTADMGFNLEIKSLMLAFSDNISSIEDIKQFSIKKNLVNTKDVREGMYSGLYNRGLSFIIIFAFILGKIFYEEKTKFYLLVFFTTLLVLVAESYTATVVMIVSLVTIIFIKILKQSFNLIFPFFLVLYFIISPLLLNFSSEKNWTQDYKNLIEKQIECEKTLEKNPANLLVLLNSKFLHLQNKLFHRKIIWNYTTNRIKENYIFGKGLSSSRKIGETEKIILEKFYYVYKNKTIYESRKVYPAIPLHPHNQTLQIWLELGFVGIFLFLLLHLLLWKKITLYLKKYSYSDVFLISTFIGTFVINQISFGLWQIWWLSGIGYFVIYTYLFNKLKTS